MKYLENGEAVEVLGSTASGIVVELLYRTEDEEMIQSGEVKFVNRVFDSAPTQAYDRQITVLRGKVEQLEAVKMQLQAEIVEQGQRHEKLLAKLKVLPALERIEEFLDQKITHYVYLSEWRAPELIEYDHTGEKWKRHDEIRLLSLFGRSNGDLFWKLNQYYDGSGTWTTVIPVRSEAEGIKVLREQILLKIGETDERPRHDLVEAANKCGVAVPPEYRLKLQQQAKDALLREAAEARVKMERAELQIKQMEAKPA